MSKPTRFTLEMIDTYVRGGYWEQITIRDLWERNAREYPDKEAYVDAKTKLTWYQAKLRSDRLALAFLELGLKRDEVLAMLLPNIVESVLVRAACEKAGIVCVTPLISIRHQEMEAILRKTEASAVVIPYVFRNFDFFAMIEEIRTRLPSLRHVLVVSDQVPKGTLSIRQMAEAPVERRYAPDYLRKTTFEPTDVSLVATTSGTTSSPKLGEHPVCVRLAVAKAEVQAMRITGADIIGIASHAVAGGGAVFCYYVASLVSAKSVLLEKWDAEEALKLFEREKVTVIAALPTQLIQMLRHPNFARYNLSSVRCISWAAAPLPLQVAEELEQRIGKCMPHYGTFDGGPISICKIDDPLEVRLRTVGKPVTGNEVRLVDEGGRKVLAGEVGEVLVRGACCTSGLYKDEEATKQAWGMLGPEGWFATGDLAKLDKDGNIILVGREKDMINRGGQNIYPEEIEDILLGHPKILEVAIVSMPDAVFSEKACAYVVPRPGDALVFEEIVSFIKEKNIAPYKLPERLEIVDRLPRVGDTGKVDKNSLRKDIREKLGVAN